MGEEKAHGGKEDNGQMGEEMAQAQTTMTGQPATSLVWKSCDQVGC